MWEQEIEAARNEINSALSARLADEKAVLIGQLNAQADDMDSASHVWPRWKRKAFGFARMNTNGNNFRMFALLPIGQPTSVS